MALYVMLDVCFRISLTTVWGGRVSRRWYTLILWGSCHQQQRTNMSTNTDWLDNGASEQQIISNACKKSSCHCAVTKCWSIQSQITGRCNRCLIISIIYFGCCRYLASGNCGLSDDKIGNASSIHLSKVRRIVQCWRLGDVKTWSLTDILSRVSVCSVFLGMFQMLSLLITIIRWADVPATYPHCPPCVRYRDTTRRARA